MKKNYNIGILGVGHIAKTFHIPAWIQNKKCKIIALCDVNRSNLKKISNKLSINKIFTKYKKMINDKNIDIVNICSPPHLHFKNIKDCIKKKKNILVEKPFTTNLSQAKIIKKLLTKDKKIYLQCALHQRYRPISIAIKKALEKNEIGKIYFINIVHRKFREIPRHSFFYSKRKFSGGGPLLDLGSHYFDLILWLLKFPKIKNLLASTNREIFKSSKMSKYLPFKSYDNEEVSFGAIKFKNNIHLNFEIGYALNVRDEQIKIEIFGSKGSIHWPDQKYYILKRNKLIKKKFNFKEKKASFNQVNSFIKNINKKNSLSNINEYLYVVKLIDSLYKNKI